MSGEPPSLAADLLCAIFAHTVEGYPEEVCGFLLGPRGAPDEARRCDNRQNALHAEDPAHFPRDARTAYNLGAKDLLLLDKSLRSPRPVQIIYHSHVDVGAYFSDEDATAATVDGELVYPVDYLVVDAWQKSARGAKLFRFQGGKFVAIACYDQKGLRT